LRDTPRHAAIRVAAPRRVERVAQQRGTRAAQR
jgi:hypothetical protein